jgi:hypothetical protein
MKKIIYTLTILLSVVSLLLVSCSAPIGLSTWKNPQANTRISKVVVMALFEKIGNMQAFEEQLVAYFNSQNLKSMKSLDLFAPFQQTTNVQLQTKLDSVAADALLIVSYKGTDVSINSTGGYYGGYRGWYGGGGQVWTTSTVNLRASLYDVKKDVLLWTGDLTVTDPNNIVSTSQQISKTIFADWLKNNLLKNPPPAPVQK